MKPSKSGTFFLRLSCRVARNEELLRQMHGNLREAIDFELEERLAEFRVCDCFAC